MKKWLFIGALVVGVLLAGAALYSLPLDTGDRSPAQPIAFSHKQHAGDNGIPCLYCHRSAARSAFAGVPAVSVCRECHLYIATGSPEIKKLIGYWNRKEPIPWVKVHVLPDHVYFPHFMHVRASVPCAHCHGNVAEMQRINRTVALKMGWCLDCHREHKASIDCWTCHK
ncbi:cytochrome c family protein [Geomonas sp. RF6]|uniref:cytochrome c3 family protein n=1 Tax=Geomonas sp. RF6 TaxID=2897342 RepID=UPI001E506153|nr:cytochrome c3 family protein [Geomonas sp. RF6]UFS70397.1 cytochrome c family protein [Geomonas sp. RF6]